MGTKTIAEKQTGTRNVLGTDWPIVDQVVREALPGRRVRWVVIRSLCNGTADASTVYASKSAAMAAL